MNGPAVRQSRPEQVTQLSEKVIVPNPLQPRRRFREAQISRLAQSMIGNGILQPVVVRPHPTREGLYEMVAGERRLRAARTLGWATLPALIRRIPDARMLEISLVENLQREELNPIEEAQAYRSLLERFGYTQETLAEKVGKDRSTVANMLRLLALPPPLRADLEEGRLTVGHARALLAVEQPSRLQALRGLILSRGLSVRETERLVNRERKAPRTQPGQGSGRRLAKGRATSSEVKLGAAQDALESRLGTRVRIAYNKGHRGRILIDFHSLEEFNRLYELLTAR